MAETKNTTVEDLLTPPVTEDVEAVESATTESDKKETTKTTEKKTSGRKKFEASKAEDVQVEESKAPDEHFDAPAANNEAVVAEVKGNTTIDSKHPPDIAAGTRIEIPTLIRLYTTAYVSTHMQTIGGKLYIYADNIVKGRIRLTDSADKVGKPGGCIGWAEVNSIVRYIK